MKLKTAWSLALKKPPRTSDEFEKLPKHVAIIMDGNGRWAKKHKLNVSRGHRQGTETLREIIRHTDDLGIGALSLYAFSTENWNRSEEEVAALMQLILDFFASEIDELDAKNVRILILGDKSRLPQQQRETLIEAENRTRKNTGLRLNIAVNYGGRAELARAARILAQKTLDGEIMPAAIDEDAFAAELYAALFICGDIYLLPVARVAQQRRLDAAGKDEPDGRDVGDGRQVGVQPVGRAAVRDGGAAFIDADVLIGPPGQFGMRPAGLIVGIAVFV